MVNSFDPASVTNSDKITPDSLGPLKRPPNSFVLYKLHFGKIVSPELMSDQKKMNVEAAKYWRLMTDEEKAVWKDQANELWEEWRIESSKRPRIVLPPAAPKPPPTPEELWAMERCKWKRPGTATCVPARSGIRDERPSASAPYPCSRKRPRSTKNQAPQVSHAGDFARSSSSIKPNLGPNASCEICLPLSSLQFAYRPNSPSKIPRAATCLGRRATNGARA